MLKIMGFFLETRWKKRRKNTVHMEEKKFKKTKRPGRDSNPRSSVLTIAVTMATALAAYETDALPLGHRALYPFEGEN